MICQRNQVGTITPLPPAQVSCVFCAANATLGNCVSSTSTRLCRLVVSQSQVAHWSCVFRSEHRTPLLPLKAAEERWASSALFGCAVQLHTGQRQSAEILFTAACDAAASSLVKLMHADRPLQVILLTLQLSPAEFQHHVRPCLENHAAAIVCSIAAQSLEVCCFCCDTQLCSDCFCCAPVILQLMVSKKHVLLALRLPA